MKKIIFGLIVLLTSVSFAQTSLYKVTKEGREMYIGGTIHLLRATDFPLPVQFDEVLKKTDVLVLETDGSKLKKPGVINKLMNSVVFKNGKTLKTVLKPKVFKTLKDKAVSLGFPLSNLMQFKPSMAVVTLQAIEMKKNGLSKQGVDMYLIKKAKELNKSQEFLETVGFQIKTLSSMGEGYENEFVNYSLKSMRKSIKELPLMIEEWKKGDDKLILKTLNVFEKEDSTVYKELLLDRNNNWMPKLKEYLKDDRKEFVAVGLAHLYGEAGILNQLKKYGCVIEQVK